MSFSAIVIAAIVMSALGLIFGALLGVTFGREFVTMTENLHMLGMGNKQLLVTLVGLLMILGSGLIFWLRKGVKED